MSKNKSIWAIEQGEYSDYRIVGVFSTKENAELICSKIVDKWYPPNVVEWAFDPHIEEINKGLSQYRVVMLRNGDTEKCETINGFSEDNEPCFWKRSQGMQKLPDCVIAVVWGKDDKHAIKIVNEIRTQAIATGEWE